jgi:hypothetical protein
MKKKKQKSIQPKSSNSNVLDTRWLSWTIIFLVALVVIWFQNYNISFQQGHHGFLSSHGATIAKNISLENNLLMFDLLSRDDEGNPVFHAYNRFPITSFLILKIPMLIFSKDLGFQILAARYTMILFYLGTMYFAYLALSLLLKNRLLSITIVLISFSSFYIQYYNDMIFNDTFTLFGIFLVFHGISVYVGDNSKYAQLVIKSLLSILFGWQAYTLILVFIIYSFLMHIGSIKKGGDKKIFTSPYFKLGLSTLMLGIFILSLQLFNESKMTNKPLNETDTISSMKKRMGENNTFENKYAKRLEFNNVAKTQFERIKIISTPGSLTLYDKSYTAGYFNLLIIIFLISLLAQYKKYKSTYRVLIIFALSGFIWGFGMKNFTMFHDFQSIYYIGIPILLYASILSFIYNSVKKKNTVLVIILFFSSLNFFYETYTFNKIKNNMSKKSNIFTKDMQFIKNKVENNKTICIDGNIKNVCGGRHACAFYLSNNYLQKDSKQIQCDFIISNQMKFSNLLSPENKKVFLFSD